jgi:F-type H+-transporting ATPase subunit delta
MADESRIEHRIRSYAEALLGVAEAEHQLDEVSDELFRFARVLEGSDELRGALTDPHIPAVRRQQIVEDLLEGRATDLSRAMVSLVVGAGRAGDLPRVIDELVAMSAKQSNRSVAEVRSAIDLSEDQRARLASALARATGGEVEVKVIVDPTVIGGIVTQIGDTVIDGSVRQRLNQLRERI